jgi:acyl transferase domain-containing protein
MFSSDTEEDEPLGEHADSVAIIGMAGRFPGAPDLKQYWRNVSGGVGSITFFTEEELAAAGVDSAQIGDAAYVKAAGVLEGVDLFDAPFFGFSEDEAVVTDPQQRVFLECAWQALEDGGYDPDAFRGRIGLFAGATISTYLLNILWPRPAAMEAVGRARAVMRNDLNFLATLAAYKLNLRGPSISVQTACSTSLVAVHLACQSLLNGECDMALAGAVSISVPQIACHEYREGGITSPDGHCRAFDARAQGTVGGSGCGLVLLKRLDDALAHRDHIHAVIRGSAINNDGSRKVGYTAPSVQGQAAAVREALAVSGVPAHSIGYVEAHGTGTPLGDPIEVAALAEAFGQGVARRSCALGSVKGNIGHLDAAAGVAGLIKAALAVGRGLIPPTLHFERANPELRLDESPFYVNAEAREWPRGGGSMRRAGVSSFGIGGTNAHLVLEEAPTPEPAEESEGGPALLVLSARSEAALGRACENLAAFLRENPSANLADVAYTLQVGRKAFAHRRAFVCEDVSGAIQSLTEPERRGVGTSFHEGRATTVAFLFNGEAETYARAGRSLYRQAAFFRDRVDACARTLSDALGPDLRESLCAGEQTPLTWPALFAVEYALAQTLTALGARPSGLSGRDVGAYVAACLAGVFTPGEALRVVAAGEQILRELAASEATEAGLRSFVSLLEGVGLKPPQTPLVSAATGRRVSAAEATDPRFWARLSPAESRPQQALEELSGAAVVLLEVCEPPEPPAAQSAADYGRGALAGTLARLWLAGVEVNWEQLYAQERPRRVELPTYPFERRRYWV